MRDRVGLLALVAALTIVLSFNLAAPAVDAAVSPCADVGFTVTYPGLSTPLQDDSSAKFGVPVGVPLTITVAVERTALIGKPITFTSPNQALQLDPASISDSGVASFNQPQARPNVNFKLSLAALNDGTVSFQATIDPSNILAGKTIGSLLTVGTQVQSARCGAKIEIYGLPSPTPTTTPTVTNTPTNTLTPTTRPSFTPTLTSTPTTTPTPTNTPTNTPTATNTPGTGTSAYRCPPADVAGFSLGESNTTTDPIFCSYPAFPGEDPFDFFCTYSAVTGALVQDHNAGFCPSNAVPLAP